MIMSSNLKVLKLFFLPSSPFWKKLKSKGTIINKIFFQEQIFINLQKYISLLIRRSKEEEASEAFILSATKNIMNNLKIVNFYKKSAWNAWFCSVLKQNFKNCKAQCGAFWSSQQYQKPYKLFSQLFQQLWFKNLAKFNSWDINNIF